MMYALEAIYVAIAAAAAIAMLAARAMDGRRLRIALIAARVGLLAATAMLVLDLDTWRSAPATIAVFAYAAFFLARKGGHTDPLPESKARRVVRRSIAGACLALSLASVLAIMAFPLADLGKPNGNRPIGTASFMLEDDSRTGVYGDAPGQARRIMVQAWYPSAGGDASPTRAIWLADAGVRAAMAGYAGIPAFMLSHLGRARTNAHIDAAPAAGSSQIPVVILSHGWTGTRFLHADLAEELASRGILVLAIDHPYGAMSVSFPDGAILAHLPQALPNRIDGEDAFLKAARFLVETYAQDIELVIAAVRGGRLPVPLSVLADPGRIALAGHSTGGGADVLVAMRDPGLAELVGLDAWVEPLGAEVDAGTAVPQLHLGSEAWNDDANEPWLARLKAASGPWAMYRVAGTGHEDFAMTQQVTPLGRLMGMSRGIDKARFRIASTRTAADWLAAALARGAASAYSALPVGGTVPELSAD